MARVGFQAQWATTRCRMDLGPLKKKKHQFEQVRLVSTHHIKLRLHLTKTYFAKFRLEQDCYHTTFNKTHLVKITRHIRTNPKIYTLNVNEQSSKQGTKYNRIHSSFHLAKTTSGMNMTKDLVQRAFMRLTKIGKTKTNPYCRGSGSRQQAPGKETQNHLLANQGLTNFAIVVRPQWVLTHIMIQTHKLYRY